MKTAPHVSKEATEYLFGPFRFIPARRALLCREVPRHLGGRAIDILAVLLERPHELISKDELIARVWPTTVVEDGNLRVHVAALRRALGEFEHGMRYISTVNGRGYSFVAPVRASAHPPARGADSPASPATDHLAANAQLASLVSLLARQRIVNLVGPGGRGEAIAGMVVAAARARGEQLTPCCASLDGVEDRAALRDLIAKAVGPGPLPDHVDGASSDAPHGSQCLLVLEPGEHPPGTVALLARQIVAELPGVRILCMSRAPMHVSGEHGHALATLDVSTMSPSHGRAEDEEAGGAGQSDTAAGATPSFPYWRFAAGAAVQVADLLQAHLADSAEDGGMGLETLRFATGTGLLPMDGGGKHTGSGQAGCANDDTHGVAADAGSFGAVGAAGAQPVDDRFAQLVQDRLTEGIIAHVREQIGSLRRAVEMLEGERDRNREELRSLREQLEAAMRQAPAAQPV